MMNFKECLGFRLKAARRAKGFKSARLFAERAKTPPTTYAQHESGKRAINIERLLNYCDLLGIDPNWLIFGGDKPYITHSTTEKSLLETASTTIKQLHSPASLIEQIKDSPVLSIDMFLYNQIVTALFAVSGELSISANEATAFCVDVYNSIISTSADKSARTKMIKLSISSLIRGNTKPAAQTLEYKLK
jgi:transcriptional regulator with XRE-family HTH domain